MMLMLSRSSILASLAIYGSSVAAFTAPTFGRPTLVHLHESAVADSPSAPSEDPIPVVPADEIEIPTNLPSDCGMDYVPLATMLATGQLEEADQVRSFPGNVPARIVLSSRPRQLSLSLFMSLLFVIFTHAFSRFATIHSSHEML
jgi:hypothetical protein